MTSNNDHVYDDCFFDRLTAESLASAKVIVPLLLNLIPPRSVIDIGCGQGAWLKVFKEYGVEVTRGLDGPWVNPSKLLIDKDNFRPVDLSQPFEVTGSYDLGICLEVAEHLPAKVSRPLIRTLTSAAPLVLFSAAVPGQGGTHHINERWPSYWESLFADYGFRRLDPIRRHIWQDHRVQWWYRQNTFLFASEKAISESPTLQEEAEYASKVQIEFLHKDILNRPTSLSGLLREVPGATWRAIKHRIYR